MSADFSIIESAESQAGDAVPPLCARTACRNTTTFLVGKNSRGQWIARELDGLYGGLFVSRANAIRYALFENGHRPEAIIIVAGQLELDMSVAMAVPAASDGRLAA